MQTRQRDVQILAYDGKGARFEVWSKEPQAWNKQRTERLYALIKAVDAAIDFRLKKRPRTKDHAVEFSDGSSRLVAYRDGWDLDPQAYLDLIVQAMEDYPDLEPAAIFATIWAEDRFDHLFG